MYDPDRYLKKEVSATHQQHVIMKPTKTGNWTIRYTEPDNNTWSLWYIYDTNVLRNNNSIYESYSNGSFMGRRILHYLIRQIRKSMLYLVKILRRIQLSIVKSTCNNYAMKCMMKITIDM